MLRNNALKQSQISRTDVLEFEFINTNSFYAEFDCFIHARELVEVCWNETIEGAPTFSYDYYYNNTDEGVTFYFKKKFLTKGPHKLYITHEKEYSIQHFVTRNINGIVNIGNDPYINIKKAYLSDLCTGFSYYFDCEKLEGCASIKKIGPGGTYAFYPGHMGAYINGYSFSPNVTEECIDNFGKQNVFCPVGEGLQVEKSREYQTFFANYADYDFLENKLNGELLICNYGDTGISYQYQLKEDKTFKKAILFAPYYHNGVGTPVDIDYSCSIDENMLLTIKSNSTDETALGTYKDTMCVAVKIIYADGTYDTDFFRLQVENSKPEEEPCLVKGTKVALYDGTTKNIEDIYYNDLLLVWNFETGAFDYQFPYFIKSKDTTDKIVRLKLENGEHLDIAKWHEVYNAAKHRFFVVNYYEIDKLKEEIKDFYVLMPKANTKAGDSLFESVKVVDFEIIRENKEYYTLLTSRTQTSFANGVMVGSLDLNFLNIQPNNQWDNSLFKIVEDNKMQISYEEFCEEFGQIEEHLFYGALYDYFIPGARHLVPIEHDWRKGIKTAVNSYWNNCKTHPKTVDAKGQIHNAWYYSFVEDDKITKFGYCIEGNAITMPEIDGVWYSVGHGKTFNPGEKVVLKFGNVFRKVNKVKGE